MSPAPRSGVIPAAGVKTGDVEQGFEDSAGFRAALPNDSFQEAEAFQELYLLADLAF